MPHPLLTWPFQASPTAGSTSWDLPLYQSLASAPTPYPCPFST